MSILKEPECLIYAWYSHSQVPDSSLTIYLKHLGLIAITGHLEQIIIRNLLTDEFGANPPSSLFNLFPLTINIPTSMSDVSCSIFGTKTLCCWSKYLQHPDSQISEVIIIIIIIYRWFP